MPCLKDELLSYMAPEPFSVLSAGGSDSLVDTVPSIVDDAHTDGTPSPSTSSPVTDFTGHLWFEVDDDHAVPNLMVDSGAPSETPIDLGNFSPSPLANAVSTTQHAMSPLSHGVSTAVARTSAGNKIASPTRVRKKPSSSIRRSTAPVPSAAVEQVSVTPTKCYTVKPQASIMMGPPAVPSGAGSGSKHSPVVPDLRKKISTSVLATPRKMEVSPDKLKKMEGNRRAAKKFRMKQKMKERELHAAVARLEQANSEIMVEITRIMQIKARRKTVSSV